MPRTAIHHESRKRELVAVAEQVFIRLGYAETTVSDLLAATGMSKGGFYHYFGSKDDVLREAIAVVLDEAAAVIDRVATLDASAIEQLSAIFRGMRELRRRHAEFVPILSVVIGDEVPARAFCEDAIRHLAPSLARVVERFGVTYPRQTTELILDAMTSLTRNPNREAYLTDAEAGAAYAGALRELLGGALGIGAHHPVLDDLAWS